MNHYGARAHRHWQTHLPERYAQIPDPESHFAALGQEIAELVDQRADQIAGDDPVGEDYLTKAGRLKEARLTAEDEVLREMLPEPQEEEPAELADQ